MVAKRHVGDRDGAQASLPMTAVVGPGETKFNFGGQPWENNGSKSIQLFY
jgi:hypothetical protein